MQELDVNDVVRSTVQIIHSEALKRGVSLSASHAEAALPVRADQVHLQQVVLNLAVNGMDAMQNCAAGTGKISIQTALVGDSVVEVSIADSGTGIPADKLNAVFDTFYTTKRQGTGLGLSICAHDRRNLRRPDLGGKSPRRWSGVSFHTAAVQRSLRMTSTPASILVVDDDASFRTAIGALLTACGYKVALYESARQLLEAPSGNEPACILLDVQMAGLSGPQLQDRLAQTGCRLPIVFVTGHGDIPTTVQTIKAGAEDFLTKPVQKEKLLAAIERALARHERDARAGSARLPFCARCSRN